MIKYFWFFLALILLTSCAPSNKKKEKYIKAVSQYITVVSKKNRDVIAITEDGHTMICQKDSLNNNIVYYAKFDNNVGKLGYESVKDKIVRIETDSAMVMLRSVVSVYGGVFYKENSNSEYNVLFYDEHMNCDTIELSDSYVCNESYANLENQEEFVRQIITLLNIASETVLSIGWKHSDSWNNIVLALEPVQSIMNCGIIQNDTIYALNTKRNVLKLQRSTEGLSHFFCLLRDKFNNKNKQ